MLIEQMQQGIVDLHSLVLSFKILNKTKSIAKIAVFSNKTSKNNLLITGMITVLIPLLSAHFATAVRSVVFIPHWVSDFTTEAAVLIRYL